MPILLFAAGRGTRMAPLTDTRPKPLIRVAGKALLDHALDLATAAGAGPVVINTHYLGQMIRDHTATRDVLISDEGDLLRETGGGLRHALDLLGGTPALTMNTDAVWNGPNPVSHLLSAWHDDMSALLLMVETSRAQGHQGSGDFDMAPDGRLTRGRDLVYTGVQIIRTDCIAASDPDVFSMNLLWDRIAGRGGLFGTVYGGQWCDVGQPQSIPLAEEICRV